MQAMGYGYMHAACVQNSRYTYIENMAGSKNGPCQPIEMADNERLEDTHHSQSVSFDRTIRVRIIRYVSCTAKECRYVCVCMCVYVYRIDSISAELPL